MSVRIAVHLAERLMATPVGSRVLVRRSKRGQIGAFEAVVVDLAERTGRRIEFYEPVGEDRGAVYRRDYELVEAADAIEAYFAPDRIMEGGTGHVVEAALARDRPVSAWTMTDRGIERVGEYEPS